MHPDQLPELSVFGGTALAPALLAILGFVVGVMWIDAIAGEVVGALSFLAGATVSQLLIYCMHVSPCG